MPARVSESEHGSEAGTPETRPGIHRARTPIALARGLQRSAGNRAVNRVLVPRLRLLRTHSRVPIEAPGTGFDSVQGFYGFEWDRAKLTSAQKEHARAFREWMETTFTPQSGYAKDTWARQAGVRAAAFPGTAAARAEVYMEMHNQIASAARGSWTITAERGADGSYLFRGNPVREVQKVFVIDPQGNCYAGDAPEGLSGRGAGKTVNYAKLRQVLPPATVPTATPTAAKPAVKPVVVGPKVDPIKPKVGGVPERPHARVPASRSGGALKGLGLQLLIMAVFWWFHRNDEEEYREFLQKMMDAKLTPAVDRALTEHKRWIDLLTSNSPASPLYAVVTADFDTERTESGIGGAPSEDGLTDIRFRSIYFSPQVVQADEMIKEEKSGAQVTSVWTTTRVTYSLLIYDPEYEEELKRLGKAWEELEEDDPLKRMKPITGKAAERLEQSKWAHRYREVLDFHLAHPRWHFREAMERSKPPSRVKVLTPRAPSAPQTR